MATLTWLWDNWLALMAGVGVVGGSALLAALAVAFVRDRRNGMV